MIGWLRSPSPILVCRRHGPHILEHPPCYRCRKVIFIYTGSTAPHTDRLLLITRAIRNIPILPDFPVTSHSWLSKEESRLAEKRMVEDVGVGDESETEGHGHARGLFMALGDWKVWWLAVALTAMVVSLSFNAFFPKSPWLRRSSSTASRNS